jgi:hypothetical protein
MKEFWKFANDYRSGIAWIARLAVSAPLMSILLGIGPPWPNATAVPVATSILQLVILMYAFQFWGAKSVPALKRRMQWSMWIMCATFVGYLFAFSFFTFEGPQGGRDVKGFVLRPEIENLRSLGLVTSEQDMLAKGNYVPERIWEEWTLAVMRPLIMVLWLAFFAAVAVYIASFVRWQGLHGKTSERAPPARKKSRTKS